MLLKYVISLWKRKIFSQLLSFVYMIPILFIVVSSISQLIMPISSSIIFEKNSDYTYIYKGSYYVIEDNRLTISKDAETLFNADNASAFLHKNTLISSKYDTKLMVDDYPFSEINKIDSLYITKNEYSLSYGIFTKDNLLTSNHIIMNSKNYPEIYLSYNSSRILEVETGDMVIIQTQSSYVECMVMGIIRPSYEESSKSKKWLNYSEMLSFPSLLIVNDNTFNKIIDENYDISFTAFSHEEIPINKSTIITNKEHILSSYKDLITSGTVVFKLLFQFSISIAIIIVLLLIEYGFVHKKNLKDIQTLGMLGMNRRSIAGIISTHVGISSFISLLISVLLCKFVYFKLLNIYCEPSVIITVWIFLLLNIVIITAIRSVFVNKHI